MKKLNYIVLLALSCLLVSQDITAQEDNGSIIIECKPRVNRFPQSCLAGKSCSTAINYCYGFEIHKSSKIQQFISKIDTSRFIISDNSNNDSLFVVPKYYKMQGWTFSTFIDSTKIADIRGLIGRQIDLYFEGAFADAVVLLSFRREEDFWNAIEVEIE